jgi:adenine-specific DNA-methyltransferase
MMDRLTVSQKILNTKGLLCVTIDDYELYNLKPILDVTFDDNYVATTVIRNNPSGRSTVSGFSINHEYAFYYANGNSGVKIGRLSHTEEQIARYDELDANGNRFEWENLRKSSAGSFRIDRPKQYYPIYVESDELTVRIPHLEWDDEAKEYIVLEEPRKSEVVAYPIDSQGQMRVWRWGLERIKISFANVKVVLKDDRYEFYTPKYLKEDGTLPRTWWDKPEYSARDSGTRMIANLFGGGKPFDFAKAVTAVEDTISIMCSDDSATILDYFAGSGTTGHAVLNLNREDGGSRKYTLVEMGEYFNTVTLPRMKKVVYSADWKDGKPQNRNTGVSHIMKYIALESYEDALSNIELDEKTHQLKSLFDDEYMLRYMFNAEAKSSLLKLDAFDAPLAYTLKVNENNETKDKIVDICETFNYLLGLSVIRQSAAASFSAAQDRNGEYEEAVKLERDNSGEYVFKQIEGKLPDGKRALIIWRTVTKDLRESNAALDAYFTKHRINPTDREFDVIYVNGDNNLENLRLDDESWKVRRIEPVFKSKMFEEAE